METNIPQEGKVTTAIEERTAQIPSGCYLTAAMAAALFIGQWAAPLLIMGLYNKIVKIHGHDQVSGCQG